jgi:hypothetical protein
MKLKQSPAVVIQRTPEEARLIRSIQAGIRECLKQVPPQLRLMAPGLEALAMAQLESGSPGELRSFLLMAREKIDNLLNYGELEPELSLEPAGDLLPVAWFDPTIGRETQRLPNEADADRLCELLAIEQDDDRRRQLLHAASVVVQFLTTSPNDQHPPAFDRTAPVGALVA